MSNIIVDPKKEAGPTRIEVKVQQNEDRVWVMRFYTLDENDNLARLSLTGKTIRFQAMIAGTETVWDNGAATGLVLRTQSGDTLGECEVTLSTAKGTGTIGKHPCELWDASSGSQHKHAVGALIVDKSEGPS